MRPCASDRIFPRILVVLLALALVPASAPGLDDEEAGWTPKHIKPRDPWQEQETALPAYPHEDRLVAAGTNSAGQPFETFVDSQSLSIDEDGVVRYTVVFISSTGVWNVNYEGLHCGERAWRRYAYGFDGQWMSLGDTPWQPVAASGFNRYQNIFYTWLMCPPGKPLTSVDDILRRMKTGADILPE